MRNRRGSDSRSDGSPQAVTFIRRSQTLATLPAWEVFVFQIFFVLSFSQRLQFRARPVGSTGVMESPWSMNELQGAKKSGLGTPMESSTLLEGEKSPHAAGTQVASHSTVTGFHHHIHSPRTCSTRYCSCCWDISAVSACPASALSFQSSLGVTADLNLVALGSSRFETAAV